MGKAIFSFILFLGISAGTGVNAQSCAPGICTVSTNSCQWYEGAISYWHIYKDDHSLTRYQLRHGPESAKANFQAMCQEYNRLIKEEARYLESRGVCVFLE